MDRRPTEEGPRRYEALTHEEKASLAEYLRETANASGEWTLMIKESVLGVVARRARDGESLKESDIWEEVVSLALPCIPAEAREGLFRRIATIL